MTDESEDRVFHYVSCEAMKLVKVDVATARSAEREFGVIAVGSRRPVSVGLKAVRRSPFRTVFVIDEETGGVLYALSQNAAYVEAAGKKTGGGGGGRPPLPPSPAEECCAACLAKGADGCMVLENLDCYCLYNGRDGTATGEIGTDEPLRALAPA